VPTLFNTLNKNLYQQMTNSLCQNLVRFDTGSGWKLPLTDVGKQNRWNDAIWL